MVLDNLELSRLIRVDNLWQHDSVIGTWQAYWLLFLVREHESLFQTQRVDFASPWCVFMLEALDGLVGRALTC